MDQDFAQKMKRKRTRTVAVIVVLALLAVWAVYALVIDRDGKEITVQVSVRCDTLAEDMSKLKDKALTDYIPQDGEILPVTDVTIKDGQSAYDALSKICKEKDIHLEASYTPAYDSYYVEGINYLYEFDAGKLSGWMFRLNGTFPDRGCSESVLKEGDLVEFLYTCDLGRDVGGYVKDIEEQE